MPINSTAAFADDDHATNEKQFFYATLCWSEKYMWKNESAFKKTDDDEESF